MKLALALKLDILNYIIETDLRLKAIEVKFNPTQIRIPVGFVGGGQWADENAILTPAGFRKPTATPKTQPSEPKVRGQSDQNRPTPYKDTNPFTSDKTYPTVGNGARKHADGSVWEKDNSTHGGSTYKRWTDEKAWERRDIPQSIYPDGGIRK